MSTENENLRKELEIQKQIAFSVGLFQEDITIKTLFQSLAEGIVIVNDSGRIILTNDKIINIFGYSREELTGTPLELLLRPADRKTHSAMLSRFFKKPSSRAMGKGFDLVGYTKTNNELPIEISLSYLETSVGTIGLAFISNISKRKEAENILLEKNKALEAFAYTLAHDLKSSLNAIIGFSGLICDTELDSEEQLKLASHIRDGGLKMSEIIDSILLFSKVDMSSVSIDTLDLLSLTKNAINRLTVEISKRNAHINLQIKNTTSKALGYGPWVEEVIFNLLGNAIKHSGDSNPRIEIGCIVENEYVSYYVKDSGSALSKEKIQELNSTIDDIKIEATSGFGLSIVSRILKKLNGKLRIESKENTGNTFSFSLPLKKD